MLRPERFELPTFWFVAKRRKFQLDLISLTSFQGASSWTPGSNSNRLAGAASNFTVGSGNEVVGVIAILQQLPWFGSEPR